MEITSSSNVKRKLLSVKHATVVCTANARQVAWAKKNNTCSIWCVIQETTQLLTPQNTQTLKVIPQAKNFHSRRIQ